MADREISELTAAGTLTGSELVHVDQGGNSRKATLLDIAGLSTGAMLVATYDPNADGIIAVAQGGTNSATASGARTNLGLGTMAVQNAATVAITGGSVTGITDLAVADGGSGASDAAGARTNFGLAIGTDVMAYSANLAGFAATTVTNVTNRVNHTGTQLAATISDFSTAADLRITAAIGSTVQAYHANLDSWSAIAPSAKQDADALLTSVSALSLTAGDMIYATGADAVARLPGGANGQVLALQDGTPRWDTELVVGGLLAANNLSDVASATTARTNLGLIQTFSSDGDDSVDDTTALQAALDTFDDITVLPGDYRLDSMLTVPPGKSLRLMAGANLRRLSAHSASTEPVVFVKGTRASLLGPGSITTENNHPEGIVVLGHRDASLAIDYNALHWNFHDVHLFGVQAAGNLGYYIPNAQITVGVSVANYFGSIRNIRVRYADVGALFAEAANAHTVVGGNFDDMITAAYQLRGAQENQFFGGFLHSSTDGVTGIRLLNKTVGPYGDSLYNTFSGFTVEPGGAASRGYEIESGCMRNTLVVQNNSAGVVVVQNERNTIINTGGRPRAPGCIGNFAFDGSAAVGPIVPINGHYNFGTLTKVSTGVYDFVYAFPALNAAYVATGSRLGAGSVDIRSITTTGFRIQTFNAAGAVEDATRVSINVMGIMA